MCCQDLYDLGIWEFIVSRAGYVGLSVVVVAVLEEFSIPQVGVGYTVYISCGLHPEPLAE